MFPEVPIVSRVIMHVWPTQYGWMVFLGVTVFDENLLIVRANF